MRARKGKDAERRRLASDEVRFRKLVQRGGTVPHSPSGLAYIIAHKLEAPPAPPPAPAVARPVPAADDAAGDQVEHGDLASVRYRGEEVEIDLVVIAVEGRAALLRQTLAYFLTGHRPAWSRRILALDGQDAEVESIAKEHGFRMARTDGKRQGLTANMRAAYGAAESDLVFSLEDDWSFQGELPLFEMAATMLAHPVLNQVRLPRNRWLAVPWDTNKGRRGDIYLNTGWHSFNPHMARRADFLKYLEELDSGKRKPRADRNMETDYTCWLRAQGRISGIMHPRRCRVFHLGGDSRTDRKWHMPEAPA